MKVTKEQKLKHKTSKSNKGITLIALVITIIVMLILVAVTISMAVNGGLFDYAGKAVSETQNAIDEEQKLANGGIKVGDVWYNSINEYLKINSGSKLGVSVTLENTKQTVNADGIKVSEIKEGVPIPVGFYYVGGTKNTGVVISDSSADANQGADAELEGNQFVWVPVLQNQKIKIQVKTESEITGITITDPLLREITTDVNGNTINASGTSLETKINPTINGTYTVKVETENEEETIETTLEVSSLYAQDFWLMTEEEWMEDTIGTKEKFTSDAEYIAIRIMGITLEEYLEEFYGTTSIDEAYEIYVQNTLAENSYETYIETYLNYTDETIDDYAESVNTYGGFYIGRYEAGAVFAMYTTNYGAFLDPFVCKANYDPVWIDCEPWEGTSDRIFR